MPPSEFAKQPFAQQVQAMKGWLANPHEVLAEESAVQHAQRLLEGERAQVAAELTRLPDKLHRELAKIGSERGEDRDFADGFFSKGS